MLTDCADYYGAEHGGRAGTRIMRRVHTGRAVAVATLLLLLGSAALVGCSDSGDARADCPKEPKAKHLVEDTTVDVQALDNRFEPKEITVEPGTEIRFVNDGRNLHNVISAKDSCFEFRIESDELGPGDEASIRFEEPGEFRYFCSIHGTEDAGMPGTAVVEE